QKTQRSRTLHRDAAFIRRSLAKDQRKERGFPRAIRPDKSNAVAAINLQRSIFKQRASAKTFRDLRNREHDKTKARNVADTTIQRKAANLFPHPQIPAASARQPHTLRVPYTVVGIVAFLESLEAFVVLLAEVG